MGSQFWSRPADGSAELCQEMLYKKELAFFPEDVVKPKAIHHEVFGERRDGKPVLVLLHGLGGSGKTWTKVAKELSKDFFVIVPDSRGHGATRYAGERFSTSMLAADLQGLLQSLHIGKVSIVGHSMGGRTAVRFAAAHPEMVDRIVVEDMHMRGRSKLLPSNAELSRQLRALPKKFATNEEAVNAYAPLFGEGYVWDVIIGEFSKPGEGGRGIEITYDFEREGNYRLYEAQGLQEELGPALRQSKAPMLFLAAAENKKAVLFGLGLDHLRENRPDAQIARFEDAGHSIHHDSLGQFIQVTRDFLKSP